MPNLSSILPPNNIVTSENEATLTNKTLTDPIIQYVAGDTSFTVPAGTTGERPSSPETGELRFNTDEGSLEQYDGTNWGAVVPDDLDINTLSINGTQVVDSSGNIDTSSVSINGITVIDDNRKVVNIDGLTVPSGTTVERPSSPSVGELRYNTDNSGLEQYNGTIWVSVVPDDIDLNTLSINGTQVVDSSGNLTNIGSIKGLDYPSTDGTEGQVLTTDGSGNVSFNDIPAAGGAELVATGTIPSAGTPVILRSDGTVEVVGNIPIAEDVGTETVFNSNQTFNISATYDSAAGKVVIAYRDNDANEYGTAIVGTVSGSSISFGSPVVFNNDRTFYTSATYDSAAGKVVIAFVDVNNSEYGNAIVGTVSGSSISFGSPVVFNSGITRVESSVYDSAAGKVVIVYQDESNSDYGTAIVGTVSGSSISFGSPDVFNSDQTFDISAAYDSAADKVVIAYKDFNNSEYGTARVGTVSGSSIGFGGAYVFNSGISNYNLVAYDSAADKVVIAYQDESNSDYGTAIVGTVSGSSISFGSPVVFNSDITRVTSATYDSAAGKVVIAYSDQNNSYYGNVIVGTVSGSSISFGSPVVFNSGQTFGISAAYDSAADKVVIAYNDGDLDRGEVITYNPTYTGTNADDFVGFAQDAAANGDTVLVATNQQIDANQIGLTPKSEYYVDKDGTLTTSDTGHPVAGFALDANTIRTGG